ncbi:MAG: hypothetical protein Q9P01_10055 [Anaerolineae bacterium]|nr:hypothetical protein [Anaerolineae bacterium]MDQ7035156.1 hypothetical protein [Anaerolineae bacterium]
MDWAGANYQSVLIEVLIVKLQEMSNAELKQIIEQLERSSKTSLDKYKRWESEQKLKLAQAEARKRQGLGGLLRRFNNWFGNQ